MMESEEVSLQATAEAREGFCCSKCNREVVPQFGGQECKFSGQMVNGGPSTPKMYRKANSDQVYEYRWLFRIHITVFLVVK